MRATKSRLTAADASAMALALDLAALGRTAPNPRVGAVIVRDGEIVGRGYHMRAGAPHAEIEALHEARERARGATLYCTLEPCNHVGRTPPCTEAILAAGIARVVVGCRDPKRHGALSGVERLRAAGLEVVVGILEPEARELIDDFATLTLLGRPLIELKAAVTLDGKIATRAGESKWITGELARAEAHRMRARADAVVVGVGTVLADDPRLDIRMVADWADEPRPVRVVVDSALRTPLHAHVVRTAREQPTWIAHTPAAPPDRREALALAGVVLLEVPSEANGKVDLAALFAELGRRDVMRVLVEGGGRLHGALLDAGLADRAAVFVAPIVLGDPQAPGLALRARAPSALAEALRLEGATAVSLGADVLVRGRFRTLTW